MSEKDHISDENLKQEFPILFDQKKKDHFEVPDGYFESLPSKIIERIESSESGKVIALNRSKNWIMAAAGIAAILILAMLLLNPSTNHLNVEDDLLSLENIEIPEDYILDFEEDLIIEVLYSGDNTTYEEEDPYIQFLEEEFETEELIFEL